MSCELLEKITEYLTVFNKKLCISECNLFNGSKEKRIVSNSSWLSPFTPVIVICLSSGSVIALISGRSSEYGNVVKEMYPCVLGARGFSLTKNYEAATLTSKKKRCSLGKAENSNSLASAESIDRDPSTFIYPFTQVIVT